MKTHSIAFRFWVQDVAKPLVFEWALLLLTATVALAWDGLTFVNVLIAGSAIAVPQTTLGAWMGVRILMGQTDPMGVLLGSVIKTLFSIVLIGAAFATLQNLGWVWQGFFAGLVSMAMSPVLFGLFGDVTERFFKRVF